MVVKKVFKQHILNGRTDVLVTIIQWLHFLIRTVTGIIMLNLKIILTCLDKLHSISYYKKASLFESYKFFALFFLCRREKKQ